MSSTEDKGLLWKLISELAALNGCIAVDTGTQTDMDRYQPIMPLGSAFVCLLRSLFSVASVFDVFMFNNNNNK